MLSKYIIVYHGWFSNYIIQGIMVRVFTNGPEDWDSIPGQVIPKIKKIVLDATLLNPQYYKALIKSKCSNLEKGVASSSTPQCNSY